MRREGAPTLNGQHRKCLLAFRHCDLNDPILKLCRAGAFNGLPRPNAQNNTHSRLVQPPRANFSSHGEVSMLRNVTSGILTLALCSLFVPSAHAMVPVSSGIASGIARAVQDTQRYYGQYCKEVWRCGRYACGWQQECYFPPTRRWRRGCPRGWTIQDGLCKPYRGY